MKLKDKIIHKKTRLCNVRKCDWEITVDCNLNCKHCLISHKPKRELSTKECFLTIDLLKGLGCKQINFTGGEALIRKDFLEILRYSSEKRMINNLFTNGTNVRNKDIIFIKKYVNSVGVSLEGTREKNDFIRGKGSYNKTINFLNKLNKKRIPFGIYFTFNKKNIRDFEETLKKIKKFNPKNIILNELVLRGRAKENKKELYLALDREEILNILEEIFPYEIFKIERGCKMNPRDIFLTSEGKFYSCTEIGQCKKTKYLGSFIPLNLDRFKEFSKHFLKTKLSKNCPYVSYVSKKITINFLTGEKCPYLR